MAHAYPIREPWHFFLSSLQIELHGLQVPCNLVLTYSDQLGVEVDHYCIYGLAI